MPNQKNASKYKRLTSKIDLFIEKYGDAIIKVIISTELQADIINETGRSLQNKYRGIPIEVNAFLSGDDIQKVLTKSAE